VSAGIPAAFERVLIFDLWGDYGLFKRFYTTASPLSFAVPPPTALAGILGAITGVDKRNYMVAFGPEECRLGLRLIGPLKKTRLGLNWVNTSGETDPYFRAGIVAEHNPVKVELLKEPRYRVYASLRDPERQEQLGARLRSGQCVYNVSLGPANLLASFRFVAEEPLVASGPVFREVTTVTPIASIRWPRDGRGVQFEEGQRFVRERLPRQMSPDRQVSQYVEVLVETSGGRFAADLSEAWEAGDETIVFL